MNIKESFELYKSLGLNCLPTNQDKSPFKCVTWKDVNFTWENFVGCYGIGVKCGKVSGNLECIDFDNHFFDAQNVVKDFLSQISELYEKYNFPIEQTMNGGFHLIYRCEEINGNLKLARRSRIEANGKIKPDVLIETRGEGGYFVCAPTLDYKWVRNDIRNIPTITKQDRLILFETARSFNTYFEETKTDYEKTNRPGDIYNNSIESGQELISELTNAGWVEVRNGYWRRPDKKDGISATLGKVAPNIFYVFSSNAYPFESEKAYTAFQVVALLKHKGNFSEFSSELAARFNLKKPERKDFKKIEEKVLDSNKLESILNESYIDLSIPVQRPPIILKIRDFENGYLVDKRVFTLGNFSAITGKSKSKKSFLAAMFMAASVKNGIVNNKLIGCLPKNKCGVILFDTEQSYYDAYRYAKNVISIVDESIINHEHFIAFNLREYSPIERCEIIDFTLTKYKDEIGYAVIDGIADLVNAINDENEATRVITLLMKWTKQFNCHITVNIHQNKNDNFATGWIGSYILKKAECIIGVQKKEGDSLISEIECQDIRGTAEFNKFEIRIQENGIPIIEDNLNISSHYEVKDIPF